VPRGGGGNGARRIVEVNEPGDAGNIIDAPAFQPIGMGPIDVLVGSTDASASDLQDAWVIRVSDASQFLATTQPTLGGEASFDTRLWLFDLSGELIMFNDDSPDDDFDGMATFSSTLAQPSVFETLPNDDGAPGNALIDEPGTLTDGQVVVLVISGFEEDPEDAAGVNQTRLFKFNDFDALYGPNPDAGEFTQWENPADDVETGSYRIRLQGAEFVPTPGGAVVACLAAAAVARRRRVG
jgi:hypothetical protein